MIEEYQLNNVSWTSLSLVISDDVKCEVFWDQGQSEYIVEYLTMTLLIQGMDHVLVTEWKKIHIENDHEHCGHMYVSTLCTVHLLSSMISWVTKFNKWVWKEK